MFISAIVFDFDGVLADTERLHLKAFQDVLAEEGVELTAGDYDSCYLGRADADVFRTIARDRAMPLEAARLRALLERKAARYEDMVAAGAVLIEGVEARVREWSTRIPLAVASGARRSEIEAVLGACGLLSCFTAIVASEDVTRGKPAPDPYLAALEAINKAGGGPSTRANERSLRTGPSTRANEFSLRTGRRQAGDDGGMSVKAAGRGREALNLVAARRVVAIEDSLSGLASARAAHMRTVAVTTNYPAHLLTTASDLVVASVASLDLATLDRLVASLT